MNLKRSGILFLLIAIITSTFINTIIIYIFLRSDSSRIFATPPDAQWWSALEVIIAFFLGTLAIVIPTFGYVYSRVHEINTLTNQQSELKITVEDIQTIISMIVDVQFASTSALEKHWKNFFTKITTIQKKGLLKSDDLILWSRFALRNNNAPICFKLRKLALELEPENIENKLNFLDILILKDFDTGELVTEHKLLDFVEDIRPKSKNESGTINADLAYYYYKIQKYDEALNYCKWGIDNNFWFGNYVAYILISYCNNIEIKELIEKIGEWENDKNCGWNELGDMSSSFREFAKCLLGYNNFDNFYKYFTSLKTPAYITYPEYNTKFYFENIFEILRKKKVAKEIEIAYLTYYYFFGSYDKKADELLKDTKTLKQIQDRINGLTDIR